MKCEQILTKEELLKDIRNRGLRHSFLVYVFHAGISMSFVKEVEKQLKLFYCQSSDIRYTGTFLLSFVVGLLTFVLLLGSLYGVNMLEEWQKILVLLPTAIFFFVVYADQFKNYYRRKRTRAIINNLPNRYNLYKEQLQKVVFEFSK